MVGGTKTKTYCDLGEWLDNRKTEVLTRRYGVIHSYDPGIGSKNINMYITIVQRACRVPLRCISARFNTKISKLSFCLLKYQK